MSHERYIGSSVSVAVVIHLVGLSTQSCQCEVLHHPHQSAWVAVMVTIGGKDVLPLVVVSIAVHAQLGMEVLVFIPEMVNTANEYYGQAELCKAPQHLFLDISLTTTAVEGRHDDKYDHKQVEWYVVHHVILVHAEEWQCRVIDVDNVGLIVDGEIIDVWDEGSCHDGHSCINAATKWGVVIESPGENCHEQGSQ